MQWAQLTHVPSVEQTMIAKENLNLIRNVLMEDFFCLVTVTPMQPECQVLTVNIPRGEQTHFDSSDNILGNIPPSDNAHLCPQSVEGNHDDLSKHTIIVS